MEEQKIQQLNRFKIEKENTIQYPIKELLKDSINDWILSDIQQINMKLGQELRLISKVNNKDDIKRLKCFVKTALLFSTTLCNYPILSLQANTPLNEKS